MAFNSRLLKTMRFSILKRISFQSRQFCSLIRVRRHDVEAFTLQRKFHNFKDHIRFISSSLNKKIIVVYPNMTVDQIASKMNVDTSAIINLLNDLDQPTNDGINAIVQLDAVELIADVYGFTVIKKSRSDAFVRPPIVTIMGHVDHGKTTLLDYLRKSSVAPNEAGGITQSIGGFSVPVPGVTDSITFVDTPGHAAFNAMRARGANLTDMVVLVVAADDGVMQQTKECITHIRNANVPYVVAVNKIDKRDANLPKVLLDLLAHNVKLEQYDGDVKHVAISALKGTNIEELLVLLNNFAKEHIFEAFLDEPVEGIILEATADKYTGIVPSIIMKNGTLSKGKVLVAGNAMCKVRQILGVKGEIINKALPSDPVRIMGFKDLPSPGDEVFEFKSEREAKKHLDALKRGLKPLKEKQPPSVRSYDKKPRSTKQDRKQKIVFDKQEHERLRIEGQPKVVKDSHPEVNIIIKADVSGSLEALIGVISKFYSKHVNLNILSSSVGRVNLNDLQMATPFEGKVYTFNCETDKTIQSKAEELKVPIKPFSVIYKLLDDLKEEIELLLPDEIVETDVGKAEVLMAFPINQGKHVVAGCKVISGVLDKTISDTVWKVSRENELLHEGKLSSLRHLKSEVSVAKMDTECGVHLDDYKNFLPGDVIILVKKTIVKRTFDWKL